MNDIEAMARRLIAHSNGDHELALLGMAAALIKANKRIDEIEAVLRDDPILWHKANGGE